MKFAVVFDDASINGQTSATLECGEGNLKITITDKSGNKAVYYPKPLLRPAVLMEDGQFAYLTQGHIDALLRYEEEQTFRKILQLGVDAERENEDIAKQWDYIHEVKKKPAELNKPMGADCRVCKHEDCPRWKPYNYVLRYGCQWFEEDKGEQE